MLLPQLPNPGFDPRTGQINEPVQFRKWQQQESSPDAPTDAPTNASIIEVFRKAQAAVENWIDDETRSALVLGGDMADIQRDPELAAILQESTKFGPEMLQKLQAHLIFMLDNRRQYHAAYREFFGRSG